MITQDMFGGHMILTKDFSDDESDAFVRYEEMMQSTSYRYPGGTVTELLDYRDGSLDAIFSTTSSPDADIVTVMEAMSFAESHNAGIDFVLPTKRFFSSSDGENRYFSKSEVDQLIYQVDRMIRGEFGEGSIDKVTIGNEYWYANDSLSAKEYGRIANYMSKGLQQTFDTYSEEEGNENWVQPKISVQAGAQWKPGENEIILDQLDMEARAAIDIVEAHFYAVNDERAGGGGPLFKNLTDFQEAEGFEGLETYISEWNTHAKPDHDAGMAQASSVLTQFDNLVKNNIDHATIWGGNYNSLSTRLASMSGRTGRDVDESDIDLKLTATGEVYRMMSHTLVGTDLMGLTLEDITGGDARNTDDISVHSYNDEDRVIVFIASRTLDDVSLDLDLEGIMPDYRHVSLSHVTTIDDPKTGIDEGDPLTFRAQPEVSTLNQEEIEGNEGQITLSGYDIVKIEFSSSDVGATVTGTDQEGRSVAVDDDIMGSSGDDTLSGGYGDDHLEGFGGDDIIVGGDGNDTLFSGSGANVLIAGDGDDVLFGGAGSNILVAGGGSDTLIGGSGRDMFISHDGDAEMTGGKEASLFHIAGNGTSTIMDFDPHKGDIIDFGDRFGASSDIFEDMFVVPGDDGQFGNVVFDQPDGGQTIIVGGEEHLALLLESILDGSDYDDRSDDIGDFFDNLSVDQLIAIYQNIPDSDAILMPDVDLEELEDISDEASDVRPDEGSSTESENDGNEEIPKINIPEEDPENEDGGNEENESSNGQDLTCFIATASYSDPGHPDVVYLRKFRDEWLAHRPAGRAFIKAYWKVGPALAALVKQDSYTQYTCRWIISRITIIVRLCWKSKTHKTRSR